MSVTKDSSIVGKEAPTKQQRLWPLHNTIGSGPSDIAMAATTTRYHWQMILCDCIGRVPNTTSLEHHHQSRHLHNIISSGLYKTTTAAATT